MRRLHNLQRRVLSGPDDQARAELIAADSQRIRTRHICLTSGNRLDDLKTIAIVEMVSIVLTSPDDVVVTRHRHAGSRPPQQLE
jgi:hypothetical protein